MPGRYVAAVVAAAVVLMSAAPRLALAAGVLPDAARPLVWSDLLWSYEQLLQGGRAPYWDTVFYYPPLVGYIAGAFSRITRDSVTYLALWSVLMAIASALVAFMLAHATDARTALLRWSLTPQLLLWSGANFDVLAIAFVVGAVLLTRQDRAVPSLAMLAIGTSVKVFPAALAPLDLLRARADPARALRGALVFAIVVLAIALPSVLAPFPVTVFVDDFAARVNFESVWALVESALAGTAVGPLVGAITLAGLIATYIVGVIPVARRAEPAVGAGLAIATVLVWTRLYSPQYSLWILPFFALTRVPERWPRLLVAADVVVFFTVYPLTLVRWGSGDPLQTALLAALAAAVALRHVALVGTWLALRRMALAR